MPRPLWALLLTSLLFLAGCASQITLTDMENNAQAGDYEVAGAVLHPGVFHLMPGETLTLADAIRRSGGFKSGNEWDDGGNPDAVQLQRVVHGSIVEYTLLAAPGGRDEAFPVLPGDYIFVPKRTFSTPIANPLPYAT
jgi:protein involved in polysaccharide export with SLBB domain